MKKNVNAFANNYLAKRNLIVIVFSFVLLSNTYSQTPSERFVSSASFNYFLSHSRLATNGEPDLNNIKVDSKVTELSERYTVISIPFYDDHQKLTGVLEAIKLNPSGIKLPNNLDYLMLFRDFRGLNTGDLKGTIELFDINFDDFNFASAVVGDKMVVSYQTRDLPSEIANKYAAELSGNSAIVENYLNQTGRHLCDLNGNNNVGFFECYKCMNNACAGEPQCFFMCYFVGDALGWVITGWGPLCQYSLAGACIIISAVY